MNSEEVPERFADWLLKMGCPPEKIPPIEKVKQMCRGDYYMVWRSMMERVQPKQIIQEKRLQVFINDIKRSQKTKIRLNEVPNKAPEELILWHQYQELKSNRGDLEYKVKVQKQELNEIIKVVSSKISQRMSIERQVEDSKRREWLLVRVAEELKAVIQNLRESLDIAKRFPQNDESCDMKINLEKCLSLVSRHHLQDVSPNTPVSFISTISDVAIHDIEEQVSSLLCGPANEIWNELYDRRASLVEKLSAINSQMLPASDNQAYLGPTTQSVLANSAALQCILTLETLKNKQNINKIQQRLTITMNQFHDDRSEEDWELLIVRCQRVKAKARISALRSQLEKLSSGNGIYHIKEESCHQTVVNTVRQIVKIDRSMETKRAELIRLKSLLSKMELKVRNVKEHLRSMFNGFHEEADASCDRFKNLNLFQGTDQIYDTVSIRQFYEQRRSKPKKKLELSLNFDVSDPSFVDDKDNQKLQFTEELKFYLKNFELEKNRKLVLESGETLWIFESLQESAYRFFLKCNEDRAMNVVFCPALTLSMNIEGVMDRVHWRCALQSFKEKLKLSNEKKNYDVCDISHKTSATVQRTDKIKKRLNENLLNLQKIDKHITKGGENLKLWSENKWRKYISKERCIDGRTYKCFEDIFVEHLNASM